MEIYIYANKDKRKESIKKVPVQVKGKQSDDFSLDTIKYPVTVVDLENYLIDGGVVFFVVYISKDGRDTKIYYSCLLPVKIRNILDRNIKKNKKLRIEFNETVINPPAELGRLTDARGGEQSIKIENSAV